MAREALEYAEEHKVSDYVAARQILDLYVRKRSQQNVAIVLDYMNDIRDQLELDATIAEEGAYQAALQRNDHLLDPEQL